MKEQRPYSLVKAIVYYLVIAAASTLASSPASTDAIAPESSNEPQKSVGIILPNWGRYEDPTLPVSQDYHLDDYYTGFTSFSYHIIDLLKLGIDWANSGGKEEAWIIAEDTTATQLINYYEEIVTALHEKGFYDYKIILLNPRGPSWRPIDLDKLDAINDPNLMIVTYDPKTPTTTEVLEVGSRALPYDETRRLIRFKKPTNAKSVTLRTAAKGWETDIDLQPSVNDPQILEIDLTTLNLPKGKNEFKFYINGDWEEGDNRELWLDEEGLLSAEGANLEQERYAQILQKYPAPEANAVLAWVDSHGDKKLSQHWQLFNNRDLMKMALVAAGAWDPSKLGAKKEPPNNGHEYIHTSKGIAPPAYLRRYHQSEFWNKMRVDNLATGENLQKMIPNAMEIEFAKDLKSHPRQQRAELVYDPHLHLIARAKAVDMVRRGYLGKSHHLDPDGYGPNYLAKEVGYGLPELYRLGNDGKSGNAIESSSDEIHWDMNFFRKTGHRGKGDGSINDPRRLLAGLLKSPPHRKHMLGLDEWNREQTHYGIGYAESMNLVNGKPALRMTTVVITAPPSNKELPELSPEKIREFITLTPAQRRLRKINNKGSKPAVAP